MSKYDDGGAAFPLSMEDFRDHNGHPQPGMTLLDYFAAVATDADIRYVFEEYDRAEFSVPEGDDGLTVLTSSVARYIYADRMIAEKRRRERGSHEQGQ